MFPIRLLEPKDAKIYMRFRLDGLLASRMAFSESYDDEELKTLQEYASMLTLVGSPPESFSLGVFTHNNELAGITTFRRDRREHARHKGLVSAMYVAPEHRGQSIGRQLLLQVIARCNQLPGLEQIHLWALHSAGAQSAAGFYQRFSFLSQGLVKKDLKINGKYVDAEYFVLYLPTVIS